MKYRKTSKPRRDASIDLLVVGAGISGLLTAALHLQKGRTVHLAEKMHKAGGRYSPELREDFWLGAGFAHDTDAYERVAKALSLNISLLPITEGGSLVHGSRGWVAPEEIPVWEQYLSRSITAYPQGGYVSMTETLLDYCESFDGFSFSLECPVVSLVEEKGKIVKAMLGADVEVEVAEVHWSADYKSLMEGLNGPEIPEPGPERVSWLKKFVKSPSQPGVVLEFCHKQKFAEFTETLLLPFSASEKEERRYLVGSILSNRDPSLCPEGAALSSWVMPLTEAEWGDNHETMKKIRSGRRLLEKAFTGFESISFDRVIVLENTLSPLTKRKGEWHPLLSNLYLAADWAMPHGATFSSVVQTLLPDS